MYYLACTYSHPHTPDTGGYQLHCEHALCLLSFIVQSQVCDRAGEAGGAERGGPAHPADPGAGALAEGDDGAALQPVHGRAGGEC